MAQTLVPGTVLRERYKIIELVGRGGMGATYRAEDLRLEGRFCALKEALPDSDATPEELRQSREQFYPEASATEAKVHPGLYRRRGGNVDLTTLSGSGFGYRVDEIARELPDPAIRCG